MEPQNGPARPCDGLSWSIIRCQNLTVDGFLSVFVFFRSCGQHISTKYEHGADMGQYGSQDGPKCSAKVGQCRAKMVAKVPVSHGFFQVLCLFIL